MNSYYEYILHRQDQMIQLAQQASSLRRGPAHRFGNWGRFISGCGDLLISCGSWMKKVSNPPINENSVSIYSQN